MDRAPSWLIAARQRWHYTGADRPPFAIVPGPGQRSVWDFPRPPAIEPVEQIVTVRVGRRELARSRACLRVCETASPPTYYLPPADVALDRLEPAGRGSVCEWKGEALYWDLVLDHERRRQVAWSYPDPFPEFERIRDHLAFYAGRVDCFVGDVQAEPQPGGYYGGWITPELVGPFKGEPGIDG